MTIKRQLQPTHNSCVSTCIAMLADVPVVRVVEKWNDLYHLEPYRIMEMFSDYDILAIPHSTVVSSLYYGQVYLITVGSLNILHGLHQLLVDMRGLKPKVFDPGMNHGECYYTWELLKELGCWSVDFRILDCPAMRD